MEPGLCMWGPSSQLLASGRGALTYSRAWALWHPQSRPVVLSCPETCSKAHPKPTLNPLESSAQPHRVSSRHIQPQNVMLEDAGPHPSPEPAPHSVTHTGRSFTPSTGGGDPVQGLLQRRHSELGRGTGAFGAAWDQVGYPCP